MLFSSLEYLFLFLPLTLLFYFGAWRVGRSQALSVLLAASLIFYAYWSPYYLLLLLGSKSFNYLMGESIRGSSHDGRRWRLQAGLAFNLLLLFTFKYLDFAIANISALAGTNWQPLGLILPLGISFFTFQQIAYLVDCSRDEVEATGPLEYFVFVTFFPQLIAGPIIHHKEILPQLLSKRIGKFRDENFARGLFLFLVGLCKKCLLADHLGHWANLGFEDAGQLSLLDSWVTALSYTFQLYFDFSGYSDMAIGAALMFNLRLPINFNSPYKAVNITEFWRRWHMTLSRWLRDYVYIPLGGNRTNLIFNYRNLFLTFLIGGIWHGAGWTFVIWGALHGSALVLHKEFVRRGGRLPIGVAIAVTFLFNVICWVIFRSKSLSQAADVLKGMIGLHGFSSHALFPVFGRSAVEALVLCLTGALIAFGAPNSNELESRFRLNWSWFAAVNILIILGVISANTVIGQEFLYFDF